MNKENNVLTNEEKDELIANQAKEIANLKKMLGLQKELGVEEMWGEMYISQVKETRTLETALALACGELEKCADYLCDCHGDDFVYENFYDEDGIHNAKYFIKQAQKQGGN